MGKTAKLADSRQLDFLRQGRRTRGQPANFDNLGVSPEVMHEALMSAVDAPRRGAGSELSTVLPDLERDELRRLSGIALNVVALQPGLAALNAGRQ